MLSVRPVCVPEVALQTRLSSPSRHRAESGSRRIRVLKIASGIAALVSGGFGVFQLSLGGAMWWLGVVNLACAAVFLTIPRLCPLGELVAPLTFVVFAYASVSFICFATGTGSGLQFYFLVAASLVLLVPLVSVVYSLAPTFRDIALQIFYLSLLWASKAFFSRPATRSLRVLLLDAALISGFIGVGLSLLKPWIFVPMAEMTQNDIPYFAGRGYGFYLQPNACAASMTLLFFLWLFVRKPHGLLRVAFTMIFCL